MESKKLSNRKKLDYEKPRIKEEVTLEQKALAGTGDRQGGWNQGDTQQHCEQHGYCS